MAGNNDLFSTSRIFAPLVPVSLTATTASGIVDRKGYEQVQFAIAFGALSGTYDTNDYWTVTLEHSDTNTGTDFAVVTDSSYIQNASAFADISTGVWKVINSGTIRDAVKSKVHRFGYKGPKRYVRLNFTKTASGPNTLAAVTAIAVGAAAAGTTGLLPSYSAGNDGVAAVAAA